MEKLGPLDRIIFGKLRDEYLRALGAAGSNFDCSILAKSSENQPKDAEYLMDLIKTYIDEAWSTEGTGCNKVDLSNSECKKSSPQREFRLFNQGYMVSPNPSTLLYKGLRAKRVKSAQKASCSKYKSRTHKTERRTPRDNSYSNTSK